MGKPTFVCVPGAWHTPSAYGALQTILKSHGYEYILISLPSVGCKPVTYDFSEDVAIIRKTITDLVDEGKDVIPVLHSYGGMPGSQALEGLGKDERNSRGLAGGVVRLVYVMAMMLPEGAQPSPRGTLENMLPFMKADLEVRPLVIPVSPKISLLINSKQTGIVTVSAEDALSVFYNDISPETAQKLASELQPQSIGVFWSTITYAPWRKIPTTYVLLENDQSFTMGYAEYLLGIAKSTDDHKIDILEKYDSGHFVMISHPDWLAEVLRRAAGEKI
jgi:pimeloyl-ACP methyl ester carboxylesterase